MDADGRDGGLADPATEPRFVWFNEQLQLLPDFVTAENSHLFPIYNLFSRHLESTHYIVPIIFGPEDDHSVDCPMMFS